MIRFLDFTLAVVGIVSLLPLFVVIALLVRLNGPPILFKQMRCGRSLKPFVLYKFRTMAVGTADLPTHLVDKNTIYPLGKILRSLYLDELPQLVNVLKGDMSLVGPRPCLVTQSDLIALRKEYGIDKAVPGITGLAQIRGVKMDDPVGMVELENQMISQFTLRNYFKLIAKTLSRTH